MAFESATEEEKLDSGKFVRCICNNVIPIKATICPFCRIYRKLIGDKCPLCKSTMGELESDIESLQSELQNAEQQIEELKTLIPPDPSV